MSARATKTNPNQWEVLVDFLLEHPEMVTKSFVGLDARQNYKNLWEQVATQLNSMGYGSKTADKWIEAFSKWKSKVKVKAQNLKLNINRTGGGGPLPPLTHIEEKLMGIIGWTVVEGDATSELGFGNGAVHDQNTESTQDSCLIFEINPQSQAIKIPELVFFKETQKITSTVSSPTPSISATTSIASEQNHVRSEQNNVPFDNENKKRKVVTKNVLRGKTKANNVGNGINRKGDEMTLLRMHQENMVVLKDINTNIARLADGQEAFLKKVNFCPRCPTAKQYSDNFDTEDY